MLNNLLLIVMQQFYPWMAGITQGLIANELSKLFEAKKNGVTREEIGTIIARAIIDIKDANINTDAFCNILADAGLIKINGTTIIATEILYATSNNSEIDISKTKSQTNNSIIETKGNASISLQGNGARIHQHSNGITISVTGNNGDVKVESKNGSSSAGLYIGKK